MVYLFVYKKKEINFTFTLGGTVALKPSIWIFSDRDLQTYSLVLCKLSNNIADMISMIKLTRLDWASSASWRSILTASLNQFIKRVWAETSNFLTVTLDISEGTRDNATPLRTGLLHTWFRYRPLINKHIRCTYRKIDYHFKRKCHLRWYKTSPYCDLSPIE